MPTLIKKHGNYFSHLQQQETNLRTQKNIDLRSLTNEELCRVTLATVREGTNHCRWPTEVIEQFLAVEV